MSIQLPAGLQCDPVQMAEVVQQYVLVGGTWLYPRVNVANNVHSQSTTVTPYRMKTKGAKTGLLIADNRDKKVLSLQPLSVHILYTVPMSRGFEGVAFILQCRLMFRFTWVDPGGPVVIILASGSEVPGFNPDRG